MAFAPAPLSLGATLEPRSGPPNQPLPVSLHQVLAIPKVFLRLERIMLRTITLLRNKVTGCEPVTNFAIAMVEDTLDFIFQVPVNLQRRWRRLNSTIRLVGRQ